MVVAKRHQGIHFTDAAAITIIAFIFCTVLILADVAVLLLVVAVVTFSVYVSIMTSKKYVNC